MHRITVVAVCLVAANLAHAGSVAPSGFEVKHVFATVRGACHTPTNYVGAFPLVKNPMTPSKLIKEGVETAYKMGEQLKNRYQTDLVKGGKFSDNNVWAFGENYVWTRQSAFVTRAGMKGDKKGKNEATYVAGAQKLKAFDGKLLHQFNKFLNPKQCPGIMKKVEAMKSDLASVLGKHKNELEEVAKNTEANIGQNPVKLWLLSETLQTMKAAGQAPAWANEKVQKALDDIAVFFLHKIQSTTDLKKIVGGRIADDIIGDMEKLKSGQPQPRNPTKAQISLFAPAQALIAGQVAAFTPEGTKFNGKAFDKDSLYPRQGAMHVLELLKSKTGNQWKVRVLYANGDSVKNLTPVQFPGCTTDGVCDYDTFVNAAARITQRNLASACK